MSESLKAKLEELLNNLKDWEKKDTSVRGVKLVRIPENKFNPARLALELVPMDDTGKPKKRKPLVITNLDLFLSYKDLFENEKVNELIETIDKIKLQKKSSSVEEPPREEDIFEI
ncbi:MAG: hypothetical protein ACTSU5_15930 [Promethearchaeota archaeon]